MTSRLLQFVAVITLSSLCACTKTKLLIVNSLADDAQYKLQYDIPYGTEKRQRLDVYLPIVQSQGQVAEKTSKPTVVFIPGGCWGACDTFPKEDYQFVAESLAVGGYSTVIINYRLYPEHLYGEIQADTASAVSWVLAHGSELGLSNPDLVLMGHSAGAHLAAILAIKESTLSPQDRQHIRGFVGLAGPYDFLPFTEAYQSILFGPESRFADSQPVNFIDGSEPPMLLLYGMDDSSVKPRNITSLARKVHGAGGRVKAICYEGIDHGEILGALSRPLRDNFPVYADIMNFLDEVGNNPRIGSLSDSAPRPSGPGFLCPVDQVLNR